MCFSAPASFIASGGLVAIGTASLVVAKKEDKVLAAIPLIFGIQQLFEGIQWLYLGHGSSSSFAGYSFLFFALLLWPIYTPTVVYVLDKKKRSDLKWFIFLGIAVALYYLWTLLTQTLSIQAYQSCVNYSFYSSFSFGNIATIAYLVAVFAPLFISSKHFFRWLGIIVAILAFISWYFFTVNFTSVWCFFAAVVSSLFFIYIKYKK